MSKKIIAALLVLFALAASYLLFLSNSQKKAENSSGSSSEISSLISSKPEESAISSEPVDPNPDFDANSKGLPVILFHHFLRDEYKKGNKNVITQSESEFESQMKALYDNGFRSVSLKDAIAFWKGEKKLRPKSVLLTFDDGYKSNVVIAAPILRKYGFTGVLFVMTGGLDYPDEEYNPSSSALQYVTRTDLKNGADVFTYACHSDQKHVDYTKADQSIITEDLKICRGKLSNSDVMAYPIGKYNQSVIELMKQLGFHYCFTTERKFAKPGVDLYAIPRFTISAGTTAEQFMNVVKTGKTGA